MVSKKQAIISWLWLIGLTGISVFLGHYTFNNIIFIPLVLLTVFLKGHQIIDIFMELAHAPIKWRFLLLSYVIIIPAFIIGIYLY